MKEKQNKQNAHHVDVILISYFSHLIYNFYSQNFTIAVVALGLSIKISVWHARANARGLTLVLYRMEFEINTIDRVNLP